jgi:hypothetical protein
MSGAIRKFLEFKESLQKLKEVIETENAVNFTLSIEISPDLVSTAKD